MSNTHEDLAEILTGAADVITKNLPHMEAVGQLLILYSKSMTSPLTPEEVVACFGIETIQVVESAYGAAVERWGVQNGLLD